MLERLFTSKNRLKILRFLLFEKQETHLREISKELKISPSAVKREIENLENMNLLKKEKTKIKLNEESNILEDLKNIFIKTDAIVYPIKEALKNKRIKYALIFGSFAKGDYSIESDVDLMVVGDISLSDIIKIINPIEKLIKRDINPVVWKLKDLQERKKTGFVKDIFYKKVVMIKGDENELRKIIR